MNQVDWYPTKLLVGGGGNAGTLGSLTNYFPSHRHFHYAEFGIYQGATAEAVVNRFPNAVLHLFDFEDKIEGAKKRFSHCGPRVVYYSNTQKYNDSYNWSLVKMIEAQGGSPIFDYVFLDGAHMIAVDALTFFLCDKLLRPGGFMDFDDYPWRLRGSSLDPSKVPSIAEQYTNEQIDAQQVKMIVDLLVKPDPRYREITTNKLFQKIA
ncbi:MAG: hypothetical protein ACT4PZ_02675 [Panacagrimonas sp.]